MLLGHAMHLLWQRQGLQTAYGRSISTVFGEQTGQEPCVELWRVSIVDGNRGSTKSLGEKGHESVRIWENQRVLTHLDQPADKVEDLVFFFLGEEVREFRTQQLERKH